MTRIGISRRTARSLFSRALFLTLALVLAASLGAGHAQAQASTFTSNTIVDFEMYVYVPCAAGGAGEFVYLSGPLHMLFVTTYDGHGGYHSHYANQPQGIRGTGETTGTIYHATGGTRETYYGRVGFVDTYVNNFKIVGEGPGNNYMIHENLHLTVNPNGTLTAYVDNFSVECRSNSYP